MFAEHLYTAHQEGSHAAPVDVVGLPPPGSAAVSDYSAFHSSALTGAELQAHVESLTRPVLLVACGPVRPEEPEKHHHGQDE